MLRNLSAGLFFCEEKRSSLRELLQPTQDQGKIRRVQILDLKHSDSRPDLVNLRNAGVQHFIVDIGADLLNIFFAEKLFFRTEKKSVCKA